MQVYESREDYLETILILSQRNKVVRSIDIAVEMGYSKPSVSRAVGILKESGYILMDSKGYITFTDKGREKAEKIYDRHINIARYLNEILGVDNSVALEDSCKMEHVLSEEAYQKMLGVLAEKDAKK